MTNTQLKLGVICGGRSAEHEVSLRSAQGVLSALDRERFAPCLLAVDRQGHFHLGAEGQSPEETLSDGAPVADLFATLRGCDAWFPLIHGPHGEDGALQGLLEYAGVPYVGSRVFASALCMDKGLFKDWLVRALQLPVGPHVALTIDGPLDAALDAHEARLTELRYPLFVKPANLGSSVGIARVHVPEELPQALERALHYDRRIVVEQGIDARELEVAVLDDGLQPPLVSDVGEIVLPDGEWYDYQMKYASSTAQLRIPAPVDETIRSRARELALQTFQAVAARGLARVDFFLERETGQLFINELNTLPGFTSISMYPKLIEHAGVSYRELITRLVEQALRDNPSAF